MNNELVFLSVIIGIMLPTYFMFATHYASNKKIRMSINIATVIIFFILGKIYREGILEIAATPFIVFSIMGIIGTPSLLFSIYTKKKMLPLTFKNRKKYYLYPTVSIVFIIWIITMIRNFIN